MTEPWEPSAYMTQRSWSALDKKLVIDFFIDRDFSNDDVSIAILRDGENRQTEKIINIYLGEWSNVDVHFSDGIFVKGKMCQKNNVLIKGVNSNAIFVDLFYGRKNKEHMHYEGVMVYCPAAYQPDPPSPPPPTPPSHHHQHNNSSHENSEAIITDPGEELFPYIYVRKWPNLSDECLHYSFIQDESGHDIPPSLSPPNIYPEHISPINEFSNIAATIHNLWIEQKYIDPCDWLIEVEIILAELLEGFDETADYFFSAAYYDAINTIWPHYHDKVQSLDYEASQRDDYARILWLAHIIKLSFESDDGALKVRDISDYQIIQIYNAVILLPDTNGAIPYQQIKTDNGFATPYAIGDLQMVRKRLLGYDRGEIARIENIMPGERREITSKKTHRINDVKSIASADENLLAKAGEDERTNLQSEAQQAIAQKIINKNYGSLDTNYGPPTTATLDGTLTKTIDFGGPDAPSYQDDVTKFARQILNTSVERIKHKVTAFRSRNEMSQTKDIISSIVDNSGNSRAVRATFKWVNKIYEASVVHYGNRLMMEFIIPKPAQSYIARHEAFTGQPLTCPKSPAQQFNVHSFEGITRDNYASICAEYGVIDIEPPPQQKIYIGLSLRGNETQSMAIPSGYQAISAKTDAKNGGISVGTIHLPDNEWHDLPAYGETMSVPISAAAPYPALLALPNASPPEPIPEANMFLVNVEIICVPTLSRMNAWQISIYQAINKAYRLKFDRYYDKINGVGINNEASTNPKYNKDVEWNTLKTACIKLLMERAVQGLQNEVSASSSPPSIASPPSELMVAWPKYNQFIDTALEWNEISYSFHLNSLITQDDDISNLLNKSEETLFANFLQADYARVLVPVTPQKLMAFLYFWATGKIWDSPDWLIATSSQEAPLVNDIKNSPHNHNGHHHNIEEKKKRSWEIIVPTAMQVLDENDDHFLKHDYASHKILLENLEEGNA